jgi:hypothetical protein
MLPPPRPSESSQLTEQGTAIAPQASAASSPRKAQTLRPIKQHRLAARLLWLPPPWPAPYRRWAAIGPVLTAPKRRVQTSRLH